MNIEVTIRAAELADAIKELASAIKLTGAAQPRVEGGELVVPAGTTLTATAVEAPAPAAEPEKPKRTRKKAAETPVEPAVAPQATEQEQDTPAPQTPAESPAEAPVAIAPAGPVPTMDQIANAGAKLLDDDASKMPALLDLLSEYGVQAITYLKEDQLASFAARLRALGAEV